MANLSDVAANWASQSSEYSAQKGKHRDTGQDVTRLYHQGRSLYSYGTHYKLGYIWQGNGKIVYLVADGDASVTTRNHANKAREALRWHAPESALKVCNLPEPIVQRAYTFTHIRSLRDAIMEHENDVLRYMIKDIESKSRPSREMEFMIKEYDERLDAQRRLNAMLGGVNEYPSFDPWPKSVTMFKEQHKWLAKYFEVERLVAMMETL